MKFTFLWVTVTYWQFHMVQSNDWQLNSITFPTKALNFNEQNLLKACYFVCLDHKIYININTKHKIFTLLWAKRVKQLEVRNKKQLRILRKRKKLTLIDCVLLFIRHCPWVLLSFTHKFESYLLHHLYS